MPAKLKPRKFRLADCHTKCSLNERNLPGGMAELVHAWYEDGSNNETIVARSDAYGHHLSEGAVANHRRKHIVPEDHLTDVRDLVAGKPTGEPLTDLQVLELIISKGAAGLDLGSVKISPDMTVRAIELKYKLTQGSVFEGFLAAMGEAMEEATDEAPAAVASEDERSQAGSD